MSETQVLSTLPEWARASVRFAALSLIEWNYDVPKYGKYRMCDVCRCSKELNNRGFIEGDGNFGNRISEFGHELLDNYAVMDGVDRSTLPQRKGDT